MRVKHILQKSRKRHLSLRSSSWAACFRFKRFLCIYCLTRCILSQLFNSILCLFTLSILYILYLFDLFVFLCVRALTDSGVLAAAFAEADGDPINNHRKLNKRFHRKETWRRLPDVLGLTFASVQRDCVPATDFCFSGSVLKTLVTATGKVPNDISAYI